MSKVLYIVANPSVEEGSYSLSIGRAFLNAYKANNPSAEVIELDLYHMHIPLIDSDLLNAWGAMKGGATFDSLSAEQQAEVTALDALTEQFISADHYIIVSPLWNLSIPPLLKAYIDTVVVAGKTFEYTPAGSVGLLKGKKGIHIHARGGVYSGERSFLDFADRYVRTIMSFIGVEMMDSIIAEGMSYSPEKGEEIKQAAIARGESAARVMASVPY